MEAFLNSSIGILAITIAQTLAILVPLLIFVAYMTYAERKIMAAMQMRVGPNVVGPFGLLQPFADAAKMLMKETIIPSGANRALFIFAPMLTFILAMMAWAVIPVNEGWAIADINVGILYLFAISSLGVYGIIIAGWASNSKYAFLGALRSAAQMVSYEVSMGFVIVTVLLCVGSLNLTAIVMAQKTVWFFMAAALPDVHHLLHLDAGRDQPPALRSGGRRVGTGGWLHGGILRHDLRPVLPGRIRQHVPDVGHDDHPVPGWLAGAGGHRALQLGAGAAVVHPEGVPVHVHLRLGARHLPALPLRPADAPGLEGVPADQPGLAGADRLRAEAGRLAAGMKAMMTNRLVEMGRAGYPRAAR
jgi:hypothetical protein